MNRLGSSRGVVLPALLFLSSCMPAEARPRVASAMDFPESPDTPLALTHVSVIDGTGAPPMPNMTLLVAGDRIADIFATGSKPLPPNTVVRELPGRFVIPGLIDAHVHVGGTEALGADALERVLRGGVTALRDMGGSCQTLADLARRAELGEVDSPDIYFAAHLNGPSSRPDPRFSAPEARALLEAMGPGCIQVLDGAWDAQLLVSGAKATGATAVKFYHSLTGRHVRVLTREAHLQGLQVWAHATLFPARPDELVDAGVDVLSHAPYLLWQGVDSLPDYHGRVGVAPFTSVAPTDTAVERVLRLMAERGTVLDATLLVFHLQAEAADSVTDFRADTTTYAQAARWATAVTRRARELGVAVAAGTDAIGAEKEGELPNLHRELELLVNEAGFLPLEAITAATRNSARAISVEDTRGTIAIGKLADLVVLRADPTADIRNTREIELVVKRGLHVSRQRATGHGRRLTHPDRASRFSYTGSAPASTPTSTTTSSSSTGCSPRTRTEFVLARGPYPLTSPSHHRRRLAPPETSAAGQRRFTTSPCVHRLSGARPWQRQWPLTRRVSPWGVVIVPCAVSP